MKKKLTIILALTLVLALFAGCGKSEPPAGAEGPVVIKVGASSTPHAEILEQVKGTLSEGGYDLRITVFDDYVLPNTALEDGDLDANYFQHTPYLDSFNKDNGTHLVSVAAIHYEPFGIYAGTCASIAELAEGAKIAVPNDGSNETRALLLLQQEGLIKLADGIDAASNATKLDIVENPLGIEIVEVQAAQLVGSLPDVALAVINGNYALQGGLNAGTDALAVEDASGTGAQTYANIVAVKEGHESDPAVLALVEALKSEAVREYINSAYSGAVVPIF